jgi:hypothetical protein
MSDGQFRLGATFDDFERFKVILEATEPGGHGAACTFGRTIRAMWQMRQRGAYLPSLTRLGGPARAEALLVVRSKHVALNAVDQPR